MSEITIQNSSKKETAQWVSLSALPLPPPAPPGGGKINIPTLTCSDISNTRYVHQDVIHISNTLAAQQPQFQTINILS